MKKTKTATLLYIMFVVVFIESRILYIPTLVANMLVAMVGITAFCYCLLKKGFSRDYTYLIIFGMIFSLLMLLSLLYNGNSDFKEILWVWTYMGIAMLLYEFKISQKTFWIATYAFAFMIALHIIRGGTPRNFLEMGSENNISVYLIFLILVAFLGQMTERVELKYIPSFICIAVCLWTGNRGGLLAAVLLIACTFVYNFFAIKKKKIATLIKLGIGILLGLIIFNNFFVDYVVAFVNKINNYGSTSVRTEIWLEYLKATFENIGNFIFGANTLNPKYPFLFSVDGNPHNTFLTLHSKFGILGCILLAILVCKVLRKSSKEKNWIIVIALIVATSRMMFDWMAFAGLYDVFFWFMFLYVIDPNNKMERSN